MFEHMLNLYLLYSGIPAECYEFFQFRRKTKKLRKIRGIPLNMEFRKIRIPAELFFDGTLDTLSTVLYHSVQYCAVQSLI